MFGSCSLGRLFIYLFRTLKPRGVYFPAHQHKSINVAAAAAARAADPRASVSPPAPSPIPFHPRPWAPSKLHYPASALRASRPGNNFPKNRKRKREAYAHSPIPARSRSPPRGGCSVCGASPVSNQVTTLQTHPLPSSPPSTDPPSSKQAPTAAPPAPHRTWTSLAGLASAAQGALAAGRGRRGT